MHEFITSVPAVLRAIPYWVCWKYIEQSDKKPRLAWSRPPSLTHPGFTRGRVDAAAHAIYIDGADHPTTPDKLAAERAYCQAFLAAARYDEAERFG